MLAKHTLFTLVLSLMVPSALACVGTSGPANDDEAAQTAESTVPSDPLPAKEELPIEEAPDAPVFPTEEELGTPPTDGVEGQDEGIAAAVSENPVDTDSVDGELGTSTSALEISARGATLNTEAKRIAGYTNRSSSYYTHTTYMNESTGTRRTDCSGLLAYIVQRKQLSAFNLIPVSDGSSRPLAKDYYDYLISRPTTANTGTSARWRRIINPKYLGPGDIVVYKYASTAATGTTGHAMMVTGYPTAGRYRELLVKVVDSAGSGHANDTRGSSYSGPGTGTLGIKVDSNGLAVGYYWRGGQSTTLNTTRMAFGHLE